MRFNDRYFDQLGHSGPVRAVVVDAATRVANKARADAPVDTGAYRDSIHVEVEETSHRVVAKVVADVEDALIVEAQTGNLNRALRSVTGG